MKTTALSFAALLCVSLSYAQEKNINQTPAQARNSSMVDILPTPFGSFSAMKAEGQVEPEVKSGKMFSSDAQEVQYKHSTSKTSDGGTATFVKFNTKSDQDIVKKQAMVKIIPKTISKKDIFKISVYPNPAMTEINILIQDGNTQEQDEKYIVRIKNLVGQNIFEQQFEGKQFRIDVSQFAKGFFLVEVSNSKGDVRHTEKVVIQ